ncbi:MAG: glycoside hydrolase family 26 protein [Bacteroidia bacterium]
MKRTITFLLCLSAFILNAQLKFVIEDFEGFADGNTDFKINGIFTYGNIKASVDKFPSDQHSYSGQRYLKMNKDPDLAKKMNYGGWGKGIGLNLVLDPQKDYLNFYLLQSDTNSFKIELQEDDNEDNVYNKDNDDSWIYVQKSEAGSRRNDWRLISIPLNKFTDANPGGDGIMNINYKHGKLLCFIINFLPRKTAGEGNLAASFDFICFSQGKLLTGKDNFDAPEATTADACNLGAWSKEGNTANFADIPTSFENNFKCTKKLGVAHFFQPFAFDGSSSQNLYPSIERINQVIQQGYIPMITLENHFVNSSPGLKQPNLYSIVEGHFDPFFTAWAKQVRQVNGTVLLRILHEFNGDWYPWCLVNNDRNPFLLINAYRHIHDIFKSQQVSNVKFIWCPNSVSWPQEKWNYIMDSYPGNEYVDYLGLDVYNGAGKGTPVWRSFRKEGIENYFILTQQLPDKPLFICETASRERKSSESLLSQSKAEWIRQMSEALQSDMCKVRLLTWFNEKETFRINSTPEAASAFANYILKENYFKSGAANLNALIKK